MSQNISDVGLAGVGVPITMSAYPVFFCSFNISPFFISPYLVLNMVYMLNTYYLLGSLLRTTCSDMNKRKLLPTKNLQTCIGGLANRLSETRIVTTWTEVGKLQRELLRGPE